MTSSELLQQTDEFVKSLIDHGLQQEVQFLAREIIRVMPLQRVEKVTFTKYDESPHVSERVDIDVIRDDNAVTLGFKICNTNGHLTLFTANTFRSSSITVRLQPGVLFSDRWPDLRYFISQFLDLPSKPGLLYPCEGKP